MEVKVDKDLCVGCGLCANMAPEVFTMEDDGKAGVLPTAAGNEAAAKEAAEACPVSAITVE